MWALHGDLDIHEKTKMVEDEESSLDLDLVLDICPSIKCWHGPKCHFLSSFSYCKEYLYVRYIFIPTLPSFWRLLLF